MTTTSAHSLRDFWVEKFRRMIALGAILAMFGDGCGHSTPNSNQTDDARPLFPVPIGGAWGFIDNRGKVVIVSRFEAVQQFSEGLAAAKYEGRWGYINRSGAEVIPFRYRTAQSFHGGVAVVDTGLPEHPVGIIDPSGSWVTQPMFQSLSAADGPGGLLFGQKEAGDGPGFYDRAGNLVLGPYSLAFPFAQGRARVKSQSEEWIIDSSGNFIAKQPVVLDGIRFSEGLIAIRRDRKLGYMDLDGNIAIEPRYDQGGEFSEGLAAVQREGRWMLIDKSGGTIAQFPPEVVFAEPLSDGLSLVTANAGPPNRKLGYVGKSGQWVVKPNWDDANPFHDGLAYVGIWKDGVVACIDQRGRRIWEGRNTQL
jgi:hypothetical protein